MPQRYCSRTFRAVFGPVAAARLWPFMLQQNCNRRTLRTNSGAVAAAQLWPFMLQQNCNRTAGERQPGRPGPANLQQRLSCSQQQRSLLQLNAATAAGSSALHQPAAWPLQPVWSCCFPHLCWTLPAGPGMLTGLRLCTPWSSQYSPTGTTSESAAGSYPGTRASSAPWRLSCTCRDWGTSCSGRPRASGAPATRSTFFESKRATWALCVWASADA